MEVKNMNSHNHQQIKVFCPIWKEKIEVDKAIAPLLIAIWRLDIETCNSCQENGSGYVWIEFSTSADAESFLELIISGLDVENDPQFGDWLYSRILGAAGGWQYEALPHDSREYLDEEKDAVDINTSLPCVISLSESIRFPIVDYDRILDILEEILPKGG